MKAILLAGGTGSRLLPLTLGVNKHLLPVGKQPMIGHALSLLRDIGATSIVIITTPEDLSGYGRLIASPYPPYTDFDGIYLTVQRTPSGIADAIKYGAAIVKQEPVIVMLADNIYSHKDVPAIAADVSAFRSGCHIWVTKTDHPSSVGILVLDDDGKPQRCVEKPKEFVGDLAVTGLYLFDEVLWQYLTCLKPSARGEYEVTDLLRMYLEYDAFAYTQLCGDWLDLGQSLDQFLDYTCKVIQCT